MKSLTDIFKALGYPRHTDKVYAVLSERKEPLLVITIAKECGVSRVVVYRCLEQLLANRLIRKTVVGKRTKYSAGNPHALQKVIQLTESKSQKIIAPYVKMREKDIPQNIRFLYGADGIRAAFDDVLTHTKRGDTFFRYTSERDLDKVNSYLAPDYRVRRDNKKLERMVISNPVSGKQKRSRLERFIRYMPEDSQKFEQNIIQLIYGDRVCMIDITKEEVTIFENKLLAEFQKSIFLALYKRLDR